jgi:hypothetical protein
MFFEWLICWHAPLNMRLVDSENNGKTDRIPCLSAPRTHKHYALSFIHLLWRGGRVWAWLRETEIVAGEWERERESVANTNRWVGGGGRDDSQSRFHVPLKEKDRETSSHVGRVTRCDSSGPLYIMFAIEKSVLQVTCVPTAGVQQMLHYCLWLWCGCLMSTTEPGDIPEHSLSWEFYCFFFNCNAKLLTKSK